MLNGYTCVYYYTSYDNKIAKVLRVHTSHYSMKYGLCSKSFLFRERYRDGRGYLPIRYVIIIYGEYIYTYYTTDKILAQLRCRCSAARRDVYRKSSCVLHIIYNIIFVFCVCVFQICYQK